MNERIEQYIKQHHCRDYFNCYGETVEDDHYFMYREEVDGLIELIVRECADVAADRDALDIYEEIREHFGVEE